MLNVNGRQSYKPVSQLAVVLAWLYTTSAPAMDLDQMRTIAGVDMLDFRANQVVQTYGHASIILPAKGETERQGKTLPAGNWALVYTPAAATADDNIKAPTKQLFRWHDFSRLVLYAKDGVGRVIVRRKPQKTSYEIPQDPYRAHQVISVSAELRQPIPLAALVKLFGDKYEETRDANKRRWLRYWVMQREGMMPLRLYAVDFGLNPRGDKATNLVANGPQVDFVTEALVSKHKLWERNMYD